MADYKVKIEDKEYTVTVSDGAGAEATVTVEGKTFEVRPAARAAAAPRPRPPVEAPAQAPATPRPTRASGESGHINAPIPGVITKLCVKVGQQVAADEIVLKLEAMKMENDIATPVAGTVKDVPVAEGTEVADGQLLVVIE